MKNKFIFFLFLQIMVYSVAFSNSPKQEYVIIQNYSSDPVTITVEFWQEQNSMRWEQAIYGINVVITNWLYWGKNTCTLYPTKLTNLVNYYPNYGLDLFGEYFYKLSEIAIPEKLKTIYKSLIIVDPDGNQLFNLENLNADKTRTIIRRPDNGNRYYLEIYDQEAFEDETKKPDGTL
jgi:hypothetical protein